MPGIRRKARWKQLTATVLDTTFRNDDNGYTGAARGRGGAASKRWGGFPAGALAAGENVTFQGDWTGTRCTAGSSPPKPAITPPDSLSAVEKIPGLGAYPRHRARDGQADRKHFGMDAMAVLDEHPERLTEVAGIGPKKAAIDPGKLPGAGEHAPGDALFAKLRHRPQPVHQDRQNLRRGDGGKD
jgi:exodeoxyribonuclease V alpha subunit